MAPIKSTNFNTNNITTKDVATRSSGMKAVPVRYEGNVLQVQTPKMSQIFDLGEPPQSTGDGIPNYNLNLSFRGKEDDPKLEAFCSMMAALDEFNLKYATEHSKELFGKVTKREIIEEFHKPIVKYSTKLTKEGGQYPPTMKVKLRFRDNRPDFEVYDKDKKEVAVVTEGGEVSLEMFQQGTKMINLLEYGGIWIVGKSFGATWKVVQSRIYSEDTFKGCAIVDSDDSDDEDSGSAVSPEVAVTDAVSQLIIDDSDTVVDTEDTETADAF
uniref:Uncharacterized protein n=1 Tax=viral metagenome TaxID=1070528 RepID=A0A6C0KC92_9ZZZZ